ncbi:MAG: plasmid recombination protein [Bacteroidales bacterium]|nr:plasmid recombination protein [Bacteroidales bacterium]
MSTCSKASKTGHWDTYRWVCGRYGGAKTIIGFDVHLDETTPHIHIQTIPIAKTKT